MAQQPAPMPPPPVASAPEAPALPAPKDAKTKDDPASNKPSNLEKPVKPDATIGKSKLEKETGTVNDRILNVLPNYGTVESSATPPPLRSGQKFRLATAGVFDWAAYPFNGLLAGSPRPRTIPKPGARAGALMASATAPPLLTTASALI